MDINRNVLIFFVIAVVGIAAIKAVSYRIPSSDPDDMMDDEIKKRFLELLQREYGHDSMNYVNPHTLDLGYLLEKKPAEWILRSYEAKHNNNRKKRFIYNFDSSPQAKWQRVNNVVTIPYKFDPQIYDTDGKTNVTKAMDVISKDTCIRFEERPFSDTREDSHVLFKSGLSCLSFVGKATEVVPQPIYLSTFCRQFVGYIIHEILHTVGLWHTHQRQDRNNSVMYFENKAVVKELSQFIILPPSVTKTYGKPYDLSSIMHFSGLQFSEDQTSPVLQTRDPLFQRTIGQRVELSFDDAWLINNEYCRGICTNTITCVNRGYQDPNNCNVCKCPDGYAGDDCAVMAPYNGVPCGGEVIVTQDVKSITSPGYKSPGYNDKQECTWRIKLSPGSTGQVEFWFEDEIAIYCIQKSCFHWVELRYGAELTQLGPRFCCQDYNNGFTSSKRGHSNGEEMMVLFRAKRNSYIPTPQPLRKGFKLMVKAINLNNCPVTKVCTPGERCNPDNGNCEACPAGWTGQDCLTDIDECSDQPDLCLNGGTCENTQGSYYCQCFGFAGVNCETNTDDCILQPCKNGGSCEDGINDYQCKCTDKYEGKNCQNVITTSSSTTSTTTTSTTTTPTPSTTSTTASTSITTPTTTTSATTSPTTKSTIKSTTKPTTTSATTKTTTTSPNGFTCPAGTWKAPGYDHCCDDSVGGKGYPVGQKAPACAITYDTVNHMCSRYRTVMARTCTTGWWGRTHCHSNYHIVCEYYSCPKYIPTLEVCYPGYQLVKINQVENMCAMVGWTGWGEPYCCYHDCGPCHKGNYITRRFHWQVDINGYYVMSDIQFHC